MTLMVIAQPVWAGINDDRFDGNIFALYAGNGSLVPARVTLAESMARSRPALLVFFLDDSKDCKQFVDTISQLQRYYGSEADFIPVNVDTLPTTAVNNPDEVGYYYKGYVPQTVLLDQSGKVVLNEVGQVSYEAIDDTFRDVFDLLPRSESVELKRRSFNEFNSELVPSQQ
ncbi:MAG: thylakoid membrane photosystem I accumulation factor [Microcoleaceae cyanobacterium]